MHGSDTTDYETALYDTRQHCSMQQKGTIMIKYLQGKHAFLSNFYPATFHFMGKKYKSSEHFYQAAKAITSEQAHSIRNAPSPAIARRRGRTIKIRDDWDKIRINVMRLALELKFREHGLGKKLIATKDKFIAEENNWGDQFWGQVNSCGSNMLGLLLMKLRTQLQEKDEK